jgi:hypothetical protein
MITRLLCLLADACDRLGTFGTRLAARLDVHIQRRIDRQR